MNIIAFLTSRGFAILLLVLSISLLVLWTRYPDDYSPYFLLVPSFVFLSIILCTVKRIFTKKSKEGRDFWGSTLFHLGMVVLVATLFFSPWARFEAKIHASKDVELEVSKGPFVNVYGKPAFWEEIPFMTFRLDNYEISYEDEKFPIDYSAYSTVGFMENARFTHKKVRIRINDPLHINGFQFLLEGGGYSPNFELIDQAGKTIFQKYVLLSNETRKEDSFDIEAAGLTIYTRFFPDMFNNNGEVGTRSPLLRNPAFGIRIYRQNKPLSEVFRGTLSRGESANFDGMELKFTELTSFAAIIVTHDPAYWGLYGGWLMIVAGLVIRYYEFLAVKKKPYPINTEYQRGSSK